MSSSSDPIVTYHVIKVLTWERTCEACWDARGSCQRHGYYDGTLWAQSPCFRSGGALYRYCDYRCLER